MDRGTKGDNDRATQEIDRESTARSSFYPRWYSASQEHRFFSFLFFLSFVRYSLKSRKTGIFTPWPRFSSILLEILFRVTLIRFICVFLSYMRRTYGPLLWEDKSIDSIFGNFFFSFHFKTGNLRNFRYWSSICRGINLFYYIYIYLPNKFNQSNLTNRTNININDARAKYSTYNDVSNWILYEYCYCAACMPLTLTY